MKKSVPFLDLQAMHAEIAGDLDAAWHKVTANSKFVGGEFVERFETEWAAFCGTRYSVGVADGTAAIELALRALEIGPGDEVIVPANTFIATWEAVVAVGARPVPIDVDPRTLLITADGVEAAITPKTTAVIPVHLFGQPVDMDAINRVATTAGIVVIEDAAQAHGATWRGRRAGGLARIGCFSFYPGKNLGAFGDAGAVVTDDEALSERIRSLANHGRHKDAADRHIHIGSNRRIDALQAAILSAKLPHLHRWNELRRRAADEYGDALADLPIDLVEVAPGAVSSYHLAVIRVDKRDEVRRALAAEDIATGIHYATPCHRQPAFAALNGLSLPVAENAAAEILSLPMFPHLAVDQIERVVAALERVVVGSRTSRARSHRPAASEAGVMHALVAAGESVR